mgnify:CR=1 FL=1
MMKNNVLGVMLASGVVVCVLFAEMGVKDV